MKKDDEHTYFHETEYGKIFNGDSYQYISGLKANSIDLIVTSPPFGLVREKEYGNVPADEYINWFRPYAQQFFRILKKSGSLVIDIGGAWNKGVPTRHLYHFKLMIMLCDEYNFHLAQDFYWYNPAKLPTPAEWVTVRRIRVKDSINKIWWLSKSEWPKASNRRVLQPYSESMKDLFENGYNAGMRPSGHDIGKQFGNNNGAAIPSNLIALANTESNSPYQKYCREHNIKTHPARFPPDLPEFFIRMLTDEGDTVLDPFAGSCVTGEVCERLRRRWTCVELRADYLKGALGRFPPHNTNGHRKARPEGAAPTEAEHYRIPRPGLLWQDRTTDTLDKAGGQSLPKSEADKPGKKPQGSSSS